jgi:phytoene desaturase
LSKHVAVIGSGFSGLSSACFLAQKGYKVTIYEKNNLPGGRARQFYAEGFTFDMGPSWYWMPDVFERFFNQFGKSVSDYYHLNRLDPSYRVYHKQGEYWDIPANLEELFALFESIEKGSSKQLQKFLDEAKYKYEVGINEMVHLPGRKVSELMQWKIVSASFKLNLFSSMSSYLKKHFSNPKLLQLLEFPVLFLGAMPSETPALYSLMNYADIALGTWYPDGGMYKIVEAMVSLAEGLGVKIRTDAEVKHIEVTDGMATSILLNDGEEIADFDILLAGADYHHVDKHLLDEQYSNYSEKYWDKRVMAPSSLLFYLGVNKKLTSLLHHNLFFDQPFEPHAQEIYKDPKWPTAPLFYVSCTSKTDPSSAPEGMENVFILIPTAPGLEDTPDIKEEYYQRIMDRLENITQQNIREHVIVRRDYAHSDFIRDYHSYKGNAYGLANTLTQTANLKPSLKSKKVRNMYYTGQLTVPGPGVPPCLISGEVVAKEIEKESK